MTRPTLAITPYPEGYRLTVKNTDGVRHDAEHCRSLMTHFAAEGIATGRDPLATPS